MKTLNFLNCFKAGYKVIDKSGEIVFTPLYLGDLILISGKLVTCDPLVFPNTEPFTVNLNPGRYPVLVSIAHIPENNDRRVGYAMLCLSKQTPIRWELATVPDQCLSLLKEGEIFGYGVDSGTGCFMDANAALLIEESLDAENFEETLANKLLEIMEKNFIPTWKWANLCIDESTGANVIAFSSGWGDGIYATYFGYDIDDNIVSVVTDFCL
jgi:hypothetical protein